MTFNETFAGISSTWLPDAACVADAPITPAQLVHAEKVPASRDRQVVHYTAGVGRTAPHRYSKGTFTLLTASHGVLRPITDLEGSTQLNAGIVNHVHVDGINGSTALRRPLMCEYCYAM